MSIESELYSSVSSANISLEQDKVCGMSFTYKTKRTKIKNCGISMAPMGFEPMTPCLQDRRSGTLHYTR